MRSVETLVLTSRLAGRFVIDWSRVPQYDVPPQLVDTDLKPYVAHNTPLVKVPPPDFDELVAKMIAELEAHELELAAEREQAGASNAN